MTNKVFLIGPSKSDNNLSMNYYLNKLFTYTINSNKNFLIYKLEHNLNFFLRRLKIPNNIKIHLHKYIFLNFNIPKTDILHFTDHVYFNPFFKKKSRIIVTVHDIIPYLAWKKILPGLHYPHFPLFFYISMKCLKYADEIIVVSNSTKFDLVKYFNIHHDRINVIYLGIDNLFRPYNYLEKIKAKKIHSLSNDSYKILLTGNQIYKNHYFAIDVIKAFSKRTRRRVQVIKSGNKDTILEDSLKNTNIDYKNIFCRDVNEMAELYNSVDCLLFPSNYEGFGLPPLEAMACGLPVIISDIDVFKETIPKYDGKIPLSDFNLFVNTLLRISNDKIFKNNLIQSGFNIAKNFTWENTIKKTIELYNKNISKI